MKHIVGPVYAVGIAFHHKGEAHGVNGAEDGGARGEETAVSPPQHEHSVDELRSPKALGGGGAIPYEVGGYHTHKSLSHLLCQCNKCNWEHDTRQCNWDNPAIWQSSDLKLKSGRS